MALAPISLASSIIGFISFAITLLTLLGVYRDLISTMRKAPEEIPIQLGNLRQELMSEKEQIRRKIRQCWGPHHIQITAKGLGTRKTTRSEEVLTLLYRTMRDLWTEFKNVERPFLVASGKRAEEIQRGDYWAENDLAEKAGNPQRVKQRGVDEAGIGTDGASYYKTDMSHRFIWWQCKDQVANLSNQVQRIQIRRIERDVYETQELLRRALGILSGGDDDGTVDHDASSDSSGGGGGGGVRRRRGSGKERSRSVSVPPPVRRASSVNRSGGRERTVEERETVKVRGSTTEVAPERPLPRERDRDRDRGSRYEVVRPGRIYVDVARPGERDRRGSTYMQDERSKYGDSDRYAER